MGVKTFVVPEDGTLNQAAEIICRPPIFSQHHAK